MLSQCPFSRDFLFYGYVLEVPVEIAGNVGIGQSAALRANRLAVVGLDHTVKDIERTVHHFSSSLVDLLLSTRSAEIGER